MVVRHGAGCDMTPAVPPPSALHPLLMSPRDLIAGSMRISKRHSGDGTRGIAENR